MAIGAAHLRARRVPGPGTTGNSTEQQRLDLDSATRSRWQEWQQSRTERAGQAAATSDLFMDVIVLLSVLVFLALVVGIGLLVLQATIHR